MVARDEALYLEALLEKRLGIKDRPVPGELGSDRDPLP